VDVDIHALCRQRRVVVDSSAVCSKDAVLGQCARLRGTAAVPPGRLDLAARPSSAAARSETVPGSSNNPALTPALISTHG